MIHKRCSKCKEIKDITSFHKDIKKKSGYRSHCKTCCKESTRIYRFNNREDMMLRNYKITDKNRNLVCDLTTEWIKENITNKSCIYCGDTEFIGCDRIDNNKGHTKDNVVPCCKLCNQTRNNDFSVEEMHKIGLVIRKIKEQRKCQK